MLVCTSACMHACMYTHLPHNHFNNRVCVCRAGINHHQQAVGAGLYHPSLTLPRWTRHGMRGVATVGKLLLPESVVRRRGTRLRYVSGGFTGSLHRTRSRGRWNMNHGLMSTAVANTAVACMALVPTSTVAVAAPPNTRTQTLAGI